MGSTLTPVTPETFAKWKRTRLDKKDAEAEALRNSKDAQAAAGKNSGMSGRDLVRYISFHCIFSASLIIIPQFTYNPEWFADEDDEPEDEWDIAKYRRETEEDHDVEEVARIDALGINDDGYRESEPEAEEVGS